MFIGIVVVTVVERATLSIASGRNDSEQQKITVLVHSHTMFEVYIAICFGLIFIFHIITENIYFAHNHPQPHMICGVPVIILLRVCVWKSTDALANWSHAWFVFNCLCSHGVFSMVHFRISVGDHSRGDPITHPQTRRPARANWFRRHSALCFVHWLCPCLGRVDRQLLHRNQPATQYNPFNLNHSNVFAYDCCSSFRKPSQPQFNSINESARSSAIVKLFARLPLCLYIIYDIYI